jgi:serine/threonine protein phosphatase PrpC
MVYGSFQLDGRGRPTEDRITSLRLSERCDLYAVFDGHSGAGVVKATVDLLPRKIHAALEAAGPQVLEDLPRIKAILEKAFVEHDKDLAKNIARLNDSGSTASVALLTPQHIVVAYLGDSPVCLLDPRTGLVLKEAGRHEPTLAGETERIKAAGGTVEIDEYGTPRVDGALMVSRAFGDFSLKFDPERPPPFESDWSRLKVTPFPDVVVWERPEAGVLALMSDGLVETESAALKPIAQVAQDIRAAAAANAFNLQKTAEQVVLRHMQESVRAAGGGPPSSYDGDDLSMILVDVGRRDLKSVAAAGGGGAAAQAAAAAKIATFLSNRARTRKGKGGRRNKTGKKHRIIKVMGV